MDTLSGQIKFTLALDYASANADRAGATLDMAGFDGVLMGVKFAVIAAGAATSIKAQCDSDSAFGSPQDIAGTAITVADDDDDQTFLIDIIQPPERYVRLYIDKDTANATAEMAWYIQYRPRTLPQSNAATNLVTIETHIAPQVGTA